MHRDLDVVTGGAGMIGSALVKKLIESGKHVAIIDDFSRGRPEFVHPQAELYGCDLAYGFPREVMNRTARIWHLACKVGGVQYMLSNQLSSHRNAAVDWNVFEAALFCRAQLLFCSTACIYPVTIQTEEWNMDVGNVNQR